MNINTTIIAPFIHISTIVESACLLYIALTKNRFKSMHKKNITILIINSIHTLTIFPLFITVILQKPILYLRK